MNKLLRILCSAFIFIAMILQGTNVYAKDGILNGIKIYDRANSGYEVTLDVNKPSTYIQKTISKDKILIKIQNTKPSKNLTTSYKNASNLGHVMLKTSSSGTIIEISGTNASDSSIIFPNGISKSNSMFWQIFLLFIISGAVISFKKRKQKEYSTKISISDEENKILKVEFERKRGLIAKGTGARYTPVPKRNVRKVTFENEDTIRELNMR